MRNKPRQNNDLQAKMQHFNDSVSHLASCVKYLEEMKSYQKISSINQEILEDVLNRMNQLESSIEKLNNASKPDISPHRLIKAIGKDKKLWLTKPESHNKALEGFTFQH